MKKLVWGLVAGLLFSLVFLGGCVQAEDGTTQIDWFTIGFFVLIIVMFYFVLIRPQQKRRKQHEQLMSELTRGDKVITAGGIYGTIESVSEDSIVIKVESGATMRIARGSIAGKVEST